MQLVVLIGIPATGKSTFARARFPGWATRRLEGLDSAAKNELLFERGINFNDVPAWQRRGIGAYWARVDAEGRDPRSGETRRTSRRRLKLDLELPMKGEYLAFVRERLGDQR